MNWRHLRVDSTRTHHTDPSGAPVYAARFDDVLKFHAPGLAPVLLSGRAWHVRPDGRPGYPQRYRRTFGFYEGLAAVQADDGWHHVHPTGEAAYTQRYTWCGNFQGGRCTVREANGAYLHIDIDGQPLYPERWRYAGDYRDGIAVVQDASGRSTHIDLTGALTHGRWFLDLDVFHKGYARARDADGWCHVDLAGQPAYADRFASVEPFYNGQARVERSDGALEVINEVGHRLVQLRPPRCSEFAALSGDMVGFWRTQTIGAAVQLGVPDRLPATVGVIAGRCGMETEAAHRLLRALGELRLVTKHADIWSLTSRGAFLRNDHPLTLADAALEYAGPFAQVWQALPDALTTASGWSVPDVFEEVAADGDRCAGHHRMLQSYARHDYPRVVEALDIGARERIIDAGGGLGTLAQLLIDRQPALNVTVLDRPEVVEAGRRQHADSSVRWHAADLFEPWGLEAEVVVLARVLHDWDDVEARRILKRARAALTPGGRILVIEMLVTDDDFAGAQCDLHLLMVTGGRERTFKSLYDLLASAGFQPAGVRHVAALPSIVMGIAR